MASKYIDLSTVKFFMNNVQELESVLKKERFVDHDLESVDLFIESVKHFADRELFPYFKEMDEKPAHYKDGTIHVHQQVENVWVWRHTNAERRPHLDHHPYIRHGRAQRSRKARHVSYPHCSPHPRPHSAV